MMKKTLIASLAFVGGMLAYTSVAQPVHREVLKELRVAERGGCQQITAELEFPLAVLGYSPQGHGALLLVRVRPLETERVDPADLASREALVPAPSPETPLQQVTWEGDAPEGPNLFFHFDRDVAYEVTNGRDFRSVVVTVHPVTKDPAPCSDNRSEATGGAK